MPELSIPDSQWPAARTAREGDPAALAAALRTTRRRTLALLSAYEDALGPDLRVAHSPQLNPPLWEVGHVGWFQDYWIARNRQRALGTACDPDHRRPDGRMAGADALYNSSVVEHTTRWHLPLPDLAATRAYLEAGLADTLDSLARTPANAETLYFFRLVLFHEDMHAEAATYMAQALDIELPPALSCCLPTGLPKPGVLRVHGRQWPLGYDGPGFAFDNELQAHTVPLADFEIDGAPLTWARYLPFVESGGYREARWWSADGWQWRTGNAIEAPRYLRRVDGEWQHRRFGHWQPLALTSPADHVSWFEADAWCRWAGRRLPTEAEWECAALSDNEFRWGDVWEWTSSRFLPYPGFCAHPYRDYSAPWFGTRHVLRGASRATSPNIAHPRYRNFFTAERNDIHSGFRSCAIDG